MDKCSVCMIDINRKHQVVRQCGHMMCVACDAEWRSHGKIVRKTGKKTTDTGETVSVSLFVLQSSCPYCRDLEQANAYLSRSRESLIHEIQLLSATLYANNHYVPNPYTFIPKKAFEDSVETPIVHQSQPARIVSEDVYIPLGEVMMNTLMPSREVVTTQPVIFASPLRVLGWCIRRRRNLECTRLQCPQCDQKLCRMCGEQCLCMNEI